jgi:hypothetical protein
MDVRRRPGSIPEIVEKICENLGADGQVIERWEIIEEAKKLGLNTTSVLPADYCDNTITGRWSRHSFLHSIGPGQYILSRLKGKWKRSGE